ncbi:MAG: GNAT family N-acetyltransferase [Burkholderiales bacterium]|nr:GNAT family N-acetyltransferase [Burkholderiales bacterium]
MPVTSDPTLTVRALARDDLNAVVAIDAALQGRSRRAYIERRLAAALREPVLHAQFAACGDDGVVLGYLLARVLEGEFGRPEPGLRLELVGVRADVRGHGIGTRLFEALLSWAGRHGMRDLRTVVDWRDTSMLRWLAALGFELAPDQILARAVADATREGAPDDDLTLPQGHGPGHEIDFGAPEDNDFERLSRDRADVRPMTPADLREIVRIDRGITGRDRTRHIAGLLAEAMGDSALRVSLTARLDGAIVGHLMARADLGDFGRTEPVAVIDTLGVDPDYAHRGVGHALLAQLFANLGALHIERAETLVLSSNLALLGFFQSAGFRPSSRLAFVRRVDALA